MIQNIDHVNIVVSDLAKAKKLFSLLGFTECDASQLSGDWISTITGLPDVKARYVRMQIEGAATCLELIEYASPLPEPAHPGIGAANEIGIRHLAFKVKDIESIVETLTQNKIQLLGTIQTYPNTGKKLIYFYGPDGILLELAEYP